jgi:hypothetical protein
VCRDNRGVEGDETKVVGVPWYVDTRVVYHRTDLVNPAPKLEW